ncbi:T6SS immunity protein Tdi1 domain-containing protein [Nocardia mangyaensis]|uniref:T6SS immunity protein Tdi1 domain-containing protein n=1 Tax=Nocardia mangyaensis TaxID=2213200 RepID=UPI002674FC66|nr:T6SS immunity protein Tdi1 domain-containing protein [Nocardia mangyaensis]MDO3647100.1 DUF1851 domain-containing protein [Nocardia mangyaensis]
MSTECFRLIRPLLLAEAMPGWAGQFPQFEAVVGYSDLGHVFLAESGGEFAVLHPFTSSAKSYGRFPSIEEFADTVLRDPDFAAYVLLPDHVADICALLGPLGDDQVYIPEPYPFLGGSMEPATYTIGDVWTFLDLVAQFQGIGSAPHRKPARVRPFGDEQFALALAEWEWIGLDGKQPVFASLFGDIFLGSEDGVWLLDIVEGTLNRMWSSFDECEAALNDPARGPLLLRTALADEVIDAGVVPAADQVYDFSHPPVLGGALEAGNIKVLDFVVAVGTAGQIHNQARFIPAGARVSIVSDQPPRRSGWRKLFGGK